MTLLTPPAYTQGGTYTALLDRVHQNTVPVVRDSAFLHRARQGFMPSRYPTYTNPVGMDIAVTACAGVIANTFVTDGGEYRFANPTSLTVTLAASSPTLNRIDVVGFRVQDHFYDASGLNQVVAAVVQGANSAGAPSAPTLPDSFIPIVQCLVNATNTSPASLTDRRQFTAPAGGILPFASATDRATIGSPQSGLIDTRLDRIPWLESWDGAAWRVHSVPISSSTADRDSAITNPSTAQVAAVSGTRQMYIYDGGAFVPYGQVAGRILSTAGVQYTTVGTTELDLAKLRIENYRVKNGSWYIFWIRLSAQFGAAGDSFTLRVRKDTALSGTVLSDCTWIGQVAGFTHTLCVGMPWLCTADDTDFDIYFSAQRVAGGNVLGINGDRRSSTWVDDRFADAAVWSEVA